MSSFRWKREFDNAAVERFNSHLPLKSAASRVIYLVLQFINLIYDETELLGFTALALPAGKNLTATCGIYSERNQYYIESFPRIRDPSQQVMENSLSCENTDVLKTSFSPSDGAEEVCVLLRSQTCPLPHVQHKCPGGGCQGAAGAPSGDPASRPRGLPPAVREGAGAGAGAGSAVRAGSTPRSRVRTSGRRRPRGKGGR